MRTINGKNLDDILKELQADFPRKDIRTHGATQKLYIPVEKIKERLDTVLGIGNWDFVPISKPELWKLGPDSYESCVLTGKLVLYDDNRVPIERSAGGGADIIYPKGDTRPTSVANAVDSAVQDVFKRCARRFGIAKPDQGLGTGTEGAGKKHDKPEPVLMEVTVLGTFQALTRGGARLSVRYQEESLTLMIWANQWKELQQSYGSIFQIGKKLNAIKFYGTIGSYQGRKQLEFSKLAPTERKCVG